MTARRRQARTLSWKKRWLFRIGSSLIGLLLSLVAAEGIARLCEIEETNVEYDAEPELGWELRPGTFFERKGDFDVTYEINERKMHDRPVTGEALSSRMKILVVGDSHTFAVGVNRDETWPQVLEQSLFGDAVDQGQVFNAAVMAYGLGQELLMMRRRISELEPHGVLVGLSVATDFYDLLPPRRGGFVYVGNYGRVYFDLDGAGRLMECRDAVGDLWSQQRMAAHEGTRPFLLRVREGLGHSALYRRFRESRAAMWTALRFQIGGESLWQGSDTALRRELGEEQQYRWNLAKAILRQMAQEAKAQGRRFAVVILPYLPQVYDEIWNASFGSRPELYDRGIASRRLEEFGREEGVEVIDTTPAMVAEARRIRGGLHFSTDRHPNVAGHRVIAQAVAERLKSLGWTDEAVDR